MTIYTLLTFFKDGMLPIKHSTVLSISKIKYNEQIIATELQNNDKVIKIFLFCKILVFFIILTISLSFILINMLKLVKAKPQNRELIVSKFE